MPIWPVLTVFFSQNISSSERLKPWFFVTFDIIISHIFNEITIEIFQVVQKMWKFSPSILTIFTNFLDILTFTSRKATNYVSV